MAETVRARYAASASERKPDLCCPVRYDARWLKAIPDEVLEKDYGCGDPSGDVREGETVLDLGSGGGKLCFIASQVVGPTGRVLGVDMTTEMLELARRHAPAVAAAVGWDNVEFRRGRIEDLRLDYDQLAAWLAEHPVTDLESLAALEAEKDRLRADEPMVADGTIDVVVSNCVLNLVAPELKAQLFREIFRVLRQGGRAVISDIVSDRDVPEELQHDPELWSGCVSGAFREDRFHEAFKQAGFTEVQLVARSSEPRNEVAGIEFRSVTVAAFKGERKACCG